MGAKCPAGQYWDSLIKKCLHCNVMCQQPLVITKCTKYCVLANCKTLPGHYYDGLLMKCVKCGDVCGRHPAECFLHCHAPVTTKKLPVQVTSQPRNASGVSVQTALEDPSILLYALLALCMVLLVSSLCLALVIFLRRRSETNADRAVVKQGQGSAQRRGQLGSNVKDLMAHARGATEPSDESSPTETCVCVHCYPDPITVVSNNRAPSRAPMAYDQQAVLHHALMQNRYPLWTQNVSHTSALEVHDESMVG
ncbi:tumor necrosis factor receptor superfamily member 13B isoform X1 [Hippocampus comes]|uniref:tumor necrosis factor receptor superfamily member 13B isoform X1 n=1 Tax=Hippocampus comes TaxID=109280 RepID=UPI00094E6BFE|nr:PREDICTED: tumor necrosis factor receptor superfamily member 13B isoform X1 [Hippocampus comes]